jgi:hypothetical protein
MEEFKKQIIILNGPPGCGKDTIADGLKRYVGQRVMFKDSLYELTYMHFGLDATLEYDYFKYTLCNDRILKEMPSKLFEKDGVWMSPREALIHTSEEIAKPLFGDDVFGKSLGEKLRRSIVLVTDGGFEGEIESLKNRGYFIKIVQLHGRGNFDNDSRGYVEKNDKDISTYRVLLEDDKIVAAVSALFEIIKKPLHG